MEKKNNDIENSEPRMVKSHDVKLDAEYAEWIAEVKHRYRNSHGDWHLSHSSCHI